jgi:hypothetical protein
MPVSMEFSFSHHYSSSAEGIEVPVTLGNGGQFVDLIAKLDTGAAHCIFERRYAKILGINPESGRLQRFRTAAGSFAAYEHRRVLQVVGIALSTARREKFVFESSPGLNVLGYLMTPSSAKSPYPTVVRVPGHGRGLDDVIGVDGPGPLAL